MLRKILNLLRPKNYLVLYTGHEGIEKVYGVFDKEKAIEVTAAKKKRAAECAILKDEDLALERRLMDKYGVDEGYWDKVQADEEYLALKKKLGPRFHGECWDPEFICVVRVTEDGTRCVCNELGFKLSSLMLR
jgi:hypothetical protein